MHMDRTVSSARGVVVSCSASDLIAQILLNLLFLLSKMGVG